MQLPQCQPQSVDFTLSTLNKRNAVCLLAQLGILAAAFPPSRARSIAFATFAAGAPIGSAFGTVFGGLLAQISG